MGSGRGPPEIPGDPVEACACRTLNPTHRLAARVRHPHQRLRAALGGLRAQCFVPGEGHVGPLGAHLLFLLLAPGLDGRGHCGEEVGERGSEGRVGRGVRIGPERRAPGCLVGNAGDVPPGVPHRPHPRARRGPGVQRAARDLAQRGVVVQHVEAPSEGGAHDVLVAPVQLQVAEGDGGRARQPVPVSASVGREVEAPLRRDEEQILILMVLLNRPHDGSVLQVPGDGRPALPVVVAPEDVGGVVAGLVPVRDREHRRRVVLACLDIVDEGTLGHPRKRRHPGPAGTRVGGEVNQPIVSAGVQGILLQRALADRGDGRVHGHGPVVVERVQFPHPSHEGQLVAIDVGGQVPAYRGPGIAPILAAPKALGCEIETARGVRAHQDGGIPVPALRRIPGLRLGLDLNGFVAPAVDPVQVPCWVIR